MPKPTSRLAMRFTVIVSPNFWKEHSGGRLDGPLDTYAFNTEAGLLNMSEPFGAHALAGRFAHGTHVLDLAAGCDPNDPGGFRREGWDYYGHSSKSSDIRRIR